MGGERGTEVSEMFINQCREHLAEQGRVYLVASSLADVKHLQDTMEMNGLATDIAAEEVLFFEKLMVLRGIHERK